MAADRPPLLPAHTHGTVQRATDTVQRAADTVQRATDNVQHATAIVPRQVTAEMIKRKPPDNSKGGDRRSYEIVVDVSGAPAHKARRGICQAPRHF